MPTETLQSPDETIDLATRRVGLLPATYYNDIPRDIRSLAFTISGIQQVAEIQFVLNSLDQALSQGLTFSQWQSTVNVEDFTQLSEARQRLVYRMHLNTAYNQGVIDFADSNDDVQFLTYDAVLDDRVREDHAALDGITRRKDDPFWDEFLPPIDFNCRCTVVPRTTEQTPPEDRTSAAQLRRITEDISPGRGFGTTRRNLLRSTTNVLRRRIRQLPERMRQPLLDALANRQALTDTWFTINMDLFRAPEV